MYLSQIWIASFVHVLYLYTLVLNQLCLWSISLCFCDTDYGIDYGYEMIPRLTFSRLYISVFFINMPLEKLS
jgi:hypothetical protein